MYVNIDGKAVALGVICLLGALVLLFPGRAMSLAEAARMGLVDLLQPGLVGVSA